MIRHHLKVSIISWRQFIGCPLLPGTGGPSRARPSKLHHASPRLRNRPFKMIRQRAAIMSLVGRARSRNVECFGRSYFCWRRVLWLLFSGFGHTKNKMLLRLRQHQPRSRHPFPRPTPTPAEVALDSQIASAPPSVHAPTDFTTRPREAVESQFWLIPDSVYAASDGEGACRLFKRDALACSQRNLCATRIHFSHGPRAPVGPVSRASIFWRG